jgi:hypothetical protein
MTSSVEYFFAADIRIADEAVGELSQQFKRFKRKWTKL